MSDVYEQVKQAVKEGRENGKSVGRVVIQRDFGLVQAEARKMLLKANTELDMEAKMDTSVEVHSKVVSGENYLTLADDITLEEFNAWAMGPITYEKRRRWNWGDMYKELKRLYILRNPEAIKYQISKDPYAEILEANDRYAPSDISDCRKVSEFFCLNRRFESLSWSHHKYAMYSNTEGRDPFEWLSLANKYSWTVSELREEIDKFKTKPTGEGDGDEEWSRGFMDVGRYTTKIQSIFETEVKKAPPADRAKFIELLEPLAKLYKSLTPGKESL